MSNILERLRTFLGLSEGARNFMTIIVAVIAIGFAARLLILWAFLEYDPEFIYDNDSYGYVSLAENLAAGNGFAWDTGMPFTPDSFRVPVYPVFLLIHKFLFGSYIPAIFTQIALSILIGIVILKIADRYLTTKAGVIALIAFLFMPFSLLVSGRYITQIVYTALAVGAVWFWLEYLSSHSKRSRLLTAILIPLTALTRPISIFFTAPFIASLGLAWFWKKIDAKKALFSSAVLIGVFLVIISPWLYRNYQVFGLPYLSSITAVQLYFYDAPAIYATAQKIGYEEARAALNTHIEKITGLNVHENPIPYTELSELTPIMKHEGLRFALADPLALFQTRAVQFSKFFTRDGIRYWIERYNIDTYSGWALIPIIAERAILALFTIGFFWFAVREFFRKNLIGTTLVLIVMYYAVLSGVMSSAGLRFPSEPLFLLVGSAGIIQIVDILRAKLRNLTTQ